LHLEFTLNLSTIFVGSFNIRASQDAYPTEVRSPELGFYKLGIERVEGLQIETLTLQHQLFLNFFIPAEKKKSKVDQNNTD
jgi:hypothetical protein